MPTALVASLEFKLKMLENRDPELSGVNVFQVKGVLKKKISRFNDARSLSTKFTRASYGWTRASDYGHSISQGNGTCILTDNRSPTEHRKVGLPETIPLAAKTADDTAHCTD